MSAYSNETLDEKFQYIIHETSYNVFEKVSKRKEEEKAWEETLE